MSPLRIPIPKIPQILRPKRTGPEPGSRPGTIITRPDLPPPAVKRIVYDKSGVSEEEVLLDTLEAAFEVPEGKVVWVDIQGLGDAEVLKRAGAALGLHPLTLEDIAHTHQRPKLEEFATHMFSSLRAVRVHEKGHIDNEQLSFILKGNLLVSFQERPGDGFEPVRRRLREGMGVMRSRKADYLFYALLDAAIDNYFPVLELYGESMEELEEAIRNRPNPELSRAVHAIRRELRSLRRAVWPMRELSNYLGKNEVPGISQDLRPSFRDCYDHLVSVAEFVEGTRERASDLGDLYQVMVSERTNQVMKVLTIISTIFIPLTFLCGVYGMNFDPDASPLNMPELRSPYGYVVLLGVMAGLTGAMLIAFWRVGWLGRRDGPKH